MSATDRLLRRAQRRIYVARFGCTVRKAGLWIGAIAFAALLAARLLGIIPSLWFSPLTLACIAVVPFVAAAVFTRRPSLAETARVVDAQAGAKELFLSATLGSESAYRGVVVEQAEARAGDLKVPRLLPLRPATGLRDLAIVVACVAAAYLWLPQLDPFKADARRQQITKQEERLAETKKITVARKQELEAKGTALSEQVDLALAKLDKTLKDVKPVERELNAKKLNEEAQDFSELWKKLADQLPKNAGDQWEKAAQAFGDAKNQDALKEMIAQLKKGDPKGLQDALQKMRDELAEIAKQPDASEQKRQLEQLAKEVAKLSNQLREKLGEPGLNESLQRALEQMDMAKLQELAKAAVDAANESLQLSQDELERIAEMFKDMENVQDALKNLQAAKQLNEKGQLDGKDAKEAGAQSQSDYEALYQKLLAERGGQPGGGDGQGDQPGQGGKSGNNPGEGRGGTVGEADSQTAMKEEKAKTQLGAGKLLMQWKEEGLGEIGARADDYQAAVRALKEGVAEAIRNEQVPPGYHSAIQKYFDRLPTEAAKQPTPP